MNSKSEWIILQANHSVSNTYLLIVFGFHPMLHVQIDQLVRHSSSSWANGVENLALYAINWIQDPVTKF